MASYARPHSTFVNTSAASSDRTKEFSEVLSFLGAAQRARLALPNQSKPDTPKKETISLVDFHQAASSMSQEIHTTSQKITELNTLVFDSSGSLFSDQSEKISSLVHSISEDVGTLNGKLDSASAYVEQKKKSLGKKSQITDHSVAVVQELKTALARSTKKFKSIVQQRSNNVKNTQERKKEFGHRNSRLAKGRPKVYTSSPLAKKTTPLHGEQNIQNGAGGGGSLQRRSQQLATTTAPLIPEDTYYESRAAAVTDIEAHILELGNVFGRVGELVADQQELTERLHENTTTAVENVEAAHTRLMRTFQQLTSGRALTLKLSGVLFSFLVFFIVFLA